MKTSKKKNNIIIYTLCLSFVQNKWVQRPSKHECMVLATTTRSFTMESCIGCSIMAGVTRQHPCNPFILSVSMSMLHNSSGNDLSAIGRIATEFQNKVDHIHIHAWTCCHKGKWTSGSFGWHCHWDNSWQQIDGLSWHLKSWETAFIWKTSTYVRRHQCLDMLV